MQHLVVANLLSLVKKSNISIFNVAIVPQNLRHMSAGGGLPTVSRSTLESSGLMSNSPHSLTANWIIHRRPVTNIDKCLLSGTSKGGRKAMLSFFSFLFMTRNQQRHCRISVAWPSVVKNFKDIRKQGESNEIFLDGCTTTKVGKGNDFLANRFEMDTTLPVGFSNT